MNAKKFFFILVGILGVTILGIFAAYFLGNSQLEAEASEVSNLKADYDVTAETIVKLQQSKLQDEEVTDLNQLLDRLLPTTKEQDKLIADIIFTARQEAGIAFENVSTFSFTGSSSPNDRSGTERSIDFPDAYEYPFTLTVEEISYEQLLNFLREIEANGRIIQVDNVQITPIANIDSGGIESLTVNLTMRAYIRP